MKAIIFGASGMVGKGVLLECLDHPEVTSVLTIGRSSLAIANTKLKQLEHSDFTDFSSIEQDLKGYDACFFCLGVSVAGLSEEAYRKITYDFTLAAAHMLLEVNPEMTFTYVSGQGTDSTEKGRQMWGRVKGKVENDLLKLGFKKAFMFRPGAIIPLRGIKSRTSYYQFFYDYFMWLLKIMKWLNPNAITDTTRIGKAMINAHLHEAHGRVLDPKAINKLSIH